MVHTSIYVIADTTGTLPEAGTRRSTVSLGFWKLPELTTIIGGVRLGYAASTGLSLPLMLGTRYDAYSPE